MTGVLIQGMVSLAEVPVPRVLALSIGGGLPASRTLSVEVFADGELHAKGEGLPFTTTGISKFDLRRNLTEAQLKALLAVGEAAAKFWTGDAKPWPDCKGARIEVGSGSTIVIHGSGCITQEWASRPQVKAMLAALDSVLPPGWTTTDVLSI